MFENTKTQPGRSLHQVPVDMPADAHADLRLDPRRVEDRLKASNAKKMGEIVDKNRDKTLSILRRWLHEGE